MKVKFKSPRKRETCEVKSGPPGEKQRSGFHLQETWFLGTKNSQKLVFRYQKPKQTWLLGTKNKGFDGFGRVPPGIPTCFDRLSRPFRCGAHAAARGKLHRTGGSGGKTLGGFGGFSGAPQKKLSTFGGFFGTLKSFLVFGGFFGTLKSFLVFGGFFGTLKSFLVFGGFFGTLKTSTKSFSYLIGMTLSAGSQLNLNGLDTSR